jgi:hypothetical protein
MPRWSSQCGLFVVGFVALWCSDSGAYAFALCKGCPELLASTPLSQRAALPQQRAQSTHLHDRSINRRWHHITRAEPRPLSLARRPALTAFAAETTSFTPSQLMDGDAIDAIVSGAIADPEPLVADAAMPTTPALRIDELFNIMAAGPSDRPEEVAALRASILTQFLMRQSPSPEDRTGFLVTALIAFTVGLLIGGAVLISAKSHAFVLPRTPVRRRDRTMLLSDRGRRLTRRSNGIRLRGRPRHARCESR